MLTTLALALMVLALFLIPLGVPGLWVMIAVLAVATWQGAVGTLMLLACAAVALGAELIEFLIVSRMNTRYGGSRLAFWGAIIGGVAGVVVGVPVPVIGSIIAGFIGTFVGAMAATLYETRRMDTASRVGWGVLLGRMWAAAVKVAAGVIILVLGAAALLL